MARVPSNPTAAPKRTAAKVAAERFAGGCACDAVRYRLLEPPLFVHACHCTRCQRESGSAFTVNAIVLARTLELRQGEPEHVAVPTDSGRQQWIARCPSCRVGLWSHYGSAQGLVRYLRVGTLDEPAAAPPLAHIFVRSKLPWVVLDGGVPTFTSHYDARKVWPADSLVRYEAVRGPG